MLKKHIAMLLVTLGMIGTMALSQAQAAQSCCEAGAPCCGHNSPCCQ